MVDGNGLENRRGETHREFESRPLRQIKNMISTIIFLIYANLQGKHRVPRLPLICYYL